MIKNGKFFVAPERSSKNFKALLARLAAEGAGRPVDQHGFADGPWTPETLANAISSIDANKDGIELRAVQVWFQQNDSGISNENIRWLARIFGCDDPQATSQWQAELKAAKDLLAKERREKRKRASVDPGETYPGHDAASNEASEPLVSDQTTDAERTDTSLGRIEYSPKSLAKRYEQLLSGGASMNLLVWYWLVFCGLGLMNYVFGTLSITYSPIKGMSKQVGFIWAPTLTFLPLVVLPLLIYCISDLITYWKRVGRLKCASPSAFCVCRQNDPAWYAKLNNFNFSFWAITLFCLFFVFGLQWGGIYLPAYFSGITNGVQIDRYLVTLVRPETISINEAILLSAVGYLYTASYIAIFMFGLLFFFIIVLDFDEICSSAYLEYSASDRCRIYEEGQKIIWGGFRIIVLSLWLATCVKLQITYLSSDSEDFFAWLQTDSLSVLGVTPDRNGWLENSSISHFTTFMMMIVTVAIFVVCIIKVRVILEGLAVYGQNYRFPQVQKVILKMLIVIALLVANLVLIGRFNGFSLLLAICAVASLHALSGPKLRNTWMENGTSKVLL